MFGALIVSGILVLIAYLLGSIPTGYLIAKISAGIDIREYGSGSTGATNVLRNVGKGAALAVLLIDLLKGVIAVILVRLSEGFLPDGTVPPSWLASLVALAAFGAVIGHSRSIWLNFTGGKSVATGLGVLLAMNYLVGLTTVGVFLVVFGVSRIVSLSSISGAIAVTALMLVWQQPVPYVIFSLIAGGFVIWRHRSNIERLLAGKEPKIGQKLQQEEVSS